MDTLSIAFIETMTKYVMSRIQSHAESFQTDEGIDERVCHDVSWEIVSYFLGIMHGLNKTDKLENKYGKMRERFSELYFMIDRKFKNIPISLDRLSFDDLSKVVITLYEMKDEFENLDLRWRSEIVK
jgi:hypothetical protein